MKLQSLYYGYEWSWRNVSSGLTPTDTAGLLACYTFPQGAHIKAYDWETSVKVPGHEVLYNLIASPDPSTWMGGFIVIPRHHPADEGVVHGALSFGDNYIEVPSGWSLWVAIAVGEGLTYHPRPLEVQGMIYIEPTVVTVPS